MSLWFPRRSFHGGRTIGVDGVAIYDHPVEHAPVGLKICPVGPRFYISGQAEKGDSPVDTAARTIASLKRTLDWLGCDTKDVVQARCFLTPIDAADDVRKELEKVFGKFLPVVFVGLNSNSPIEIELIASAPPAKSDAPAIEFLTPPDMPASPFLSRVVRVNRGNYIYTSGIVHSSPDTNKQAVGVFDKLKRVFKDANSDFGQLAKATYYVTNGAASNSLAELHPRYYDPMTPPAASKVMIPSLGEDKQINLMVDMIGVSHP